MVEGKTYVQLTGSPPFIDAERGDLGYIDGYLRGGDDVPYAAVVWVASGKINMVPLNCLKAYS